jgi:hypothetical protein
LPDLAGDLREALEPYLRADTGVIAAFAGKAIKIFKTLPPVNATPPYGFIAGLLVREDRAECVTAFEVDLQLDVWSLTSPPGFAEAQAIGAAFVEAVRAMEDVGDSPPAFDLAGWRIVGVGDITATYLTDPSDGKTVHGIVTTTLSVDLVD